jgi:rod shape-determining protein MreC
MHDIISRHRPLALLATLVVAQVMLLAFQIKGDHDVRLIRYWAVMATTPVERSGTWFFLKIGRGWSGYVALHGARVENRELHQEIDYLQLRNRELESDAAEAQRLSVLLNFRQIHVEVPMLAAQVIGASADPSSHTLFINRGEHDHVRRNQAVITGDGIVGKIVEVLPNSAQVLLINDKDSGVGSLLLDTRTHGVVKGTPDADVRMDYVVNDEKVHNGEVILTSGEDRIFPKGLLVGTVTGASPGNPFQVIHVQPATRLDRLEDVLVLLTQQELAPDKTGAFAVAPEITVPAIPGAQTGLSTLATSPSSSGVPAASSQPPAPAAGNQPASSNAAKPVPPAANSAAHANPVSNQASNPAAH